MVVEESGTEQVFASSKKIKCFLEDRKSDLLVRFKSVEFTQITAYLADIFHHHNELNLLLKGKAMNMVKASEKLKSFTGKLPQIWSRRLQSGNLANFPFLDQIVVEGGVSLQRNVQWEIVAHMEFLSASFDNYFSPGELNVMRSWIVDPLSFNVDKLPDDESCKEDLIDLKESRNMKIEFESMVLECRTGTISKVGRKKHWQFCFLSRLLTSAKPGFLSWFT